MIGALAELETSSQEAEQLAAAVADKEEKNNAAIAAMQAELQALKDQFDAKEEERTRAEAAMLDVKGKLMATSQFKALVFALPET
ncbi:unnamed protein product [Effrenium voratum]|nr:unnamed protein product [Effrenium voratum]